MSGAHRGKASRRATALAVAAIIMVLVALAAAFTPPGGGKTTTAIPRRGPTVHLGAFIHPLPSPPSNPPLATPKPSKTYPSAPRTFPAPLPRTYPPPAPPTYPPPSPAPQPSRTYPPPPPSPPPDPGADLPPAVVLTPPLPGVVSQDVPGWNAMTHSQAQLSVRYVSMARPLPPSWVHSAMRHGGGAAPVIEITPTAPGQPLVTLASIAAGGHDGWLKAMRDQLDALHRPAVISFAPEVNGNWYAWSREGPAAFITAWRHVHAVIGAEWFKTWLWQVSARNAGDPAAADFGPYWPGGQWVDWTGLDGYYYLPSDYFERKFGQSLAEVQRFWGGPIIIAETGISPATGHMAQSVTDLFNGVYRHGLLGLIYFNLPPACPPLCGPYHPDVRLDHQPAALAAYVEAVNGTW